jgi:hypothetical protein
MINIPKEANHARNSREERVDHRQQLGHRPDGGLTLYPDFRTAWSSE